MNFDPTGKIALVTGANRGIGKAIVESLLAAGATKVYAGVRRLEAAMPLVEAYGDQVVPVLTDLSDPTTLAVAATTAADAEIVINNAGVLKTANPLADDAIRLFEEELTVNVKGLLHMARVFAPVLKQNGGGAFVQLNSVASMKSFADFSTYCASKAASYSFTQALRDTLSEQGTLVVSVHPGPIATDMANDAGLGEGAEPASVVADALIEGLRAGKFHVFPDSMARQVGEVYEHFATNIVEANLMEG